MSHKPFNECCEAAYRGTFKLPSLDIAPQRSSSEALSKVLVHPLIAVTIRSVIIVHIEGGGV